MRSKILVHKEMPSFVVQNTRKKIRGKGGKGGALKETGTALLCQVPSSSSPNIFQTLSLRAGCRRKGTSLTIFGHSCTSPTQYHSCKLRFYYSVKTGLMAVCHKNSRKVTRARDKSRLLCFSHEWDFQEDAAN